MEVDKKIRVNRGVVLSLVIIGVAAVGWLLNFDFTGKNYIEIVGISIAKTTAFGGMAMFAWSLILGARFAVFDRLFHGLDKMYTAHRFFGSLSVALLLLHPIGLTVAQLPSKGIGALGMWVDIGNIGLLLGMIALYGLVAVVIWSVNAKVRHEVFVRVHRVLGVFFVFGAAHAFMLGGVLADNTFVYWYMFVLSAVAIISFVYHSLLADFLQKQYVYTVQSVKELPGKLYDIRLRPKYRILKFTPGQFVYLSFERLDIHGHHPFTIASGNRTSQMQFLVKAQGDFTASLNQLQVGDKARIKGPYGGFSIEDKRFDKQLWIAGGVGITPFLSKARSLPYNRRWPRIDLVYATRYKYDAAALKELQHVQHTARSFHITHLRENTHGIVSLHDIHKHFGDLSEYAIFVCGPPGMLNAYIRQAEHMGLEDNMHYEEFSF